MSNHSSLHTGRGGREDSARHYQHFTAHLDSLLHTCGAAGLTLFAVSHIVCLSFLTCLQGRTFAFNKDTRHTDQGPPRHDNNGSWTSGGTNVQTQHVLIVRQLQTEIYIESSSPAALYRILGSKNMQGFWSAMQERSSPLAWTGLRGITTWGQHDIIY